MPRAGTSSPRISGCCARVDVDDEEIRFPLADVPSPALDEFAARISADRGFALLNAGAAWPNKRWPAGPVRRARERFSTTACGLTPVVLWGPGEEAAGGRRDRGFDRHVPCWRPDTGLPTSSRSRARPRWSSRATPARCTSRPPSARRPSACSDRPIRRGTALMRPGDLVVSRYESCGCHYERAATRPSWCLGGLPVPEVCAAVQRRVQASRSDAWVRSGAPAREVARTLGYAARRDRALVRRRRRGGRWRPARASARSAKRCGSGRPGISKRGAKSRAPVPTR